MDVDALFEAFAFASQVPKILQLFDQICALLEIDQTEPSSIYTRLKSGIKYWRAEKLWAYLDKRAGLKEYCEQNACKKLSILVAGAGPCGLRTAIECALLGAHVVLVEQRECFSRNNVLHIWPFVIQDLKNLGIKVFYPKFCRGSIDHISIRQLQCALLKVALVLGVQFHNAVAFQGLVFPELTEARKVIGWRASFEPVDHILSEYVFDVLIGADGKRNTVPGFPKREMRGKLAIGITANFVNRGTVAEEKVQEISGVAYIFNQKFFNDMKNAVDVDLENIVYYKDETHYFVMCAKKQSLLDKGVIIKDYEDASLLLSPDNIDQNSLCSYAVASADFATGGKLPVLEFARNRNGKEDVALFDFTSLYSAQCSVRLVERLDRRLLLAIVGDSLHEPFWPTGSGCARGFLGVFDVAWMLRSYGLGSRGLMQLIAERESIYRLLAQAKPENLQKQLQKYTIDPRTRYLNLEMSVQPLEVCGLVDTDNPRNIDVGDVLPLRVDEGDDLLDPAFSTRYKLLRFCQQALQPYKLRVYNFDSCWENGRALAALLAKFRPKLVDYIELCCAEDKDAIFQQVAPLVDREYGIACKFCSAESWSDMGTESRVEFIGDLVSKFKMDKQRMEEILLSSIRASAIDLKRKPEVHVDSSRAKKSGSIQQRTNELLSSLSSSSSCDEKEDLLIRDFLEGRYDGLQEGQVREVLVELNHEEPVKKENSNPSFRSVDFVDFDELNRRIVYGDLGTKHYTKRPAVDKLNPERLFAVEKIITGEVEAEKIRELYRRKRRSAKLLTRKMDKRDISEMESKLERTAMGLLFDKEQFRVISSREEKIMSANAAAARQAAQGGFRKEDEKYKEVDEKLQKADLLLKNSNLAGVETVTRMRQQNVKLFADRRVSAPVLNHSFHSAKPPPPPPKKVLLSKSASGRSVTSPCGVQSSVDMCCGSTSGNRQQICQLCRNPVYFVERMLVEGMYIHKKCFRCAFCERPLRIGNCSQDRALEKYNPRFFCMQHLNLPLREKIARIEKLNPGLVRGTEVGSLPTGGRVQDSHIAASLVNTSCAKRNSQDENLSKPCFVTAPNSPSVIVEKTLEKLRIQKESGKPGMGLTSGFETAERAQFETFKRRLRAEIEERRQHACGSSSGDEETHSAHESPPGPVPLELSTEISEESTTSSDEEFLEADLAELEETVLENVEKNLEDRLSEAQAVSLLQSFNRRRSMGMNLKCASPTADTSLSSGEMFITPKSTMRAVSDDFQTPVTAFETPKGYGFQTPMTAFETPKGHGFQTPMTAYETPKSHRKPPIPVTSPVKDFGALTLSEYRAKGQSKICVKGRPGSDCCDAAKADGKSFQLEETSGEMVSRLPVNAEQRLGKRQPLLQTSGNGLLARLYGPKGLQNYKKDHSCTGEEGSTRFLNYSLGTSKNIARVTGQVHLTPDNLNEESGKPIADGSKRSACINNTQNYAKVLDDVMQSPPLSFSSKNIRRVQKRAEQIVRQKERERVRTAQDLQRALQETEIRKSEVRTVGTDLEKRLREAPDNQWVLEQWMLYVHEMEQLVLKEQDLLKRVQELEVIEEYKQLQRQLKALQNAENAESQVEKRLLQKMLEVIEKRDKIQKELENCSGRPSNCCVSKLQTRLGNREYSFKDFAPFFLH